MSEKERLDNLIYQKGLAESREKAKAMIMAGIVYLDEVKIDKPGTKVAVEANIHIKGKAMPYVSRGGLKLEKAIARFPISLKDKIAMDIGASTGGFTDCMLQNGAAKVYAVDVGYGQLAWKLRTDERVVCLERTNIRYVTREQVPELLDFVSIDVSFISLTKVLPVAHTLLRVGGEVIALIKPQFEAGREKIGKKGVVRDEAVHREVIQKIVNFCFEELCFSVRDLTFSPVRGPEGNIEYLVYLQKIEKEPINEVNCEKISKIVEDSHVKI